MTKGAREFQNGLSQLSAKIPERDFLAWHSEASSLFGMLDCHPLSGCFKGLVTDRPLGPLQLMDVSTTPLRVNKTKRHVNCSSTDSLWVGLVKAGQALFVHDDGEYNLGPGDIYFYSSREAHTLNLWSDTSLLFLKVPEYLAKDYFPDQARWPLHKVPSRTGVGYVAAQLLRSAADQAPAIDLRSADRLVEHVLGTLRLAAGIYDSCDTVAPQRPRTTVTKRLKYFIDANLCDEALSPEKVAAKCGISHRYLNKLFAREGLTPSRYILEQRLHRCHETLTDPAGSHRSISDVAFSFGFNNLSTFCHSFKGEFGVTAGELRRSVRGAFNRAEFF